MLKFAYFIPKRVHTEMGKWPQQNDVLDPSSDNNIIFFLSDTKNPEKYLNTLLGKVYLLLLKFHSHSMGISIASNG